jgi:hypothetical protein
MASRHRTFWALVFVLGVGLRLGLYSGYGLGDDPGFLYSYSRILRSGTYNPIDHYQMRFGLWVPVVGGMRLLGVSEAGFIGPITLCSIVNLALVYLLARQEWDRPWALLAMGLAAVYPLDVLCSTLFAPDMILATYCFTALWLYRKALGTEGGGAGRMVWAGASALILFFGFVAKPWVAFVGPLFAVEAVRHWRRGWGCTLVTGGGFALLVAGYLGWQRVRFGDWLYHISIENPVSIFLPYSREILLDYPRMLFAPNMYGSYFAGYYPHALVLLAVVFIRRARSAGKWAAFFAMMLAGLAALPSHREKGQWVLLVPHIFRYLALVSIPLCLALAAYVREGILWQRGVGAAATAGFVGLSIVQCVALTAPTRDAFGEQRRAVAFLRDFPEDPVWGDGELTWRFTSFAPSPQEARRARWLRSEDPARRQAEFAAIKEGLVVTGGGRLPWYGCTRCTPNLGTFPVPPTWTLLKEFDGPISGYREEPRRLWRVSAAVAEAQALLGERPTPEAKRELLRALVERRDDAVAAEVGEALLRDAPPAERGELLRWTGLALLRSDRWRRGERLLEEHLAAATDPAEVRDEIIQLALAAAARADFAKAHAWAARLRERLPGTPPDPQLEDIESGLAEGVSMYHTGRLEDARRRFAALTAHDNPLTRRRARYFLALTLFHMDRFSEALEQSDAYKAAYGEDPDWVELHYRHAENLIVHDPAAAREVLGDIATRFPASFWAGEARRWLDRLPGAGSTSADGRS